MVKSIKHWSIATKVCDKNFNLTKKFLKLLKSACPLEGVLLLIHGAMHVPDIEDPEGNWISEVRSIVGDSCIIAVCFDLHGNVTDEIINNIKKLQKCK